MKKKIMGAMESFAKAMVQPLMFLSAAGILIVVGVLLTNSTITRFLPFLQWGPIQMLGKLIYNAAMAMINNLSVLFVIGLPAAFAKTDKHKAALLGLITYLMYLVSSNTLLTLTDTLAAEQPMIGLYGTGQAKILGIQCVDMSVFGGIILGCIVGWVYNRTCQKRFKGAMQIFAGANYSYVWLLFTAIVFALVTNTVWPVVQGWISALGGLIKSTGTFGIFLYGFLERLLLPTGLHHLVYTPFQFSDLGGVLQLGETTIAGAYPIVVTEMQMPVEKFSDSIYYTSIGFTKMFGYFGIGAAFVYTAYPENRKKTFTMILPLVISACLSSITEPIDFMFIFAAPLLYLLHSVIAGLFMAMLKAFGVIALWNGNLLGSILTNIANASKTEKMWLMWVLGLVQIVVYFVVFTFFIKKFNYHTPGREGEPLAAGAAAPAAVPAAAPAEAAAEAPKAAASASDDEMAMNVINGLGGKANIQAMENCITRLRVTLADPSLLNEALINKTGSRGIVKKDNDIQIVYGMQVAEVRQAVEAQLAKL